MQPIIVFVSMEAKFQSIWWGAPFQSDQKDKSCMLLCRGTAKILKEFASLLLT
jgi:hypothetical protein